MKPAFLSQLELSEESVGFNYSTYFFIWITGLMGPLGFAPFHMPGVTILSLAFLFSTLIHCSAKQAATLGFIYGLGYFGLGVSWVIISIHDYGQLNYLIAGITTLLFIAYLSLFPALVSYLYKLMDFNLNKWNSMLLFSSLWCLGEWLRANLFGGFPWLFVGTTQIDTPLKYLAPVVGTYGLSLLCLFAATLLTLAIKERTAKRYAYLILFLLFLLIPSIGAPIQWTQIEKKGVSVGLVQANLSMRDKWNDELFWSLLKYYEQAVNQLLGKQLIILPESAIPLPAIYLNDYLLKLDQKALKAKSSLLLGILQPTDDSESNYYNTLIGLGQGEGKHIKHQLVPFGEYIPKPFVPINRWLNLPEPNLLPGTTEQPLIKVGPHAIASLICYEIAYPKLLRMQLPLAEWIVSISDNGWFGRSLASYQQLQMAQVLSLLTGRYQILVNNDGLSSVIDNKGEIVSSLPPFSSGILESQVFSAKGATPWILYYDYPAIIFCLLFSIFILFLQFGPFSKH